MLSREERAEIDEELARLPSRWAGCIEALKAVQRHRGWVDDPALVDVAAYLGMSRDHLDAVASFYNLIFRRPVGRHVILLCDSVSCWILGCDRLRGALREQLGADLGETSSDGRFTLLPMACLGACERAPALMVGEELYGNVDEDEIPRILERHD